MTQGAPRVIALRPLRHACHLCGTCCQGWRVHMSDDAEVLRIQRQAAELGIDDPLEERTLRTHKGRCVFLSDENRCRIHERFGSDEKPLVCRQYPRRATLTEDGLRVGLDPTCSSTDRSWADGPEVEPYVGLRSEIQLAPDLAQSERALIGLLLDPNMTIARFVAIITGAPKADGELPVGFVGRMIAALRVAHLPALMEDPDHGPELLWRLEAMAQLLKELDPASPPPWEGLLSPANEAFALEVLRRHLFMRLGDPTLPPIAQTLLVLAGIMLAGWSDPIGDYFGTSLSAWMRLIRLQAVWARIMPVTETARWLLSGDGPPPSPEPNSSEPEASEPEPA